MNRLDHELVAHHSWLRRLARLLARSSERADDLIQDTYVTALRKAPADEQLLPWLKAVMRKLAWGAQRGERRRTQREARFALTEPRMALPDALGEHHFDHERLAVAMAQLPEPFHSTLVERFFKGRSCVEIARSENVAPGTVRWRQTRGLELLRAALEPPRRKRAFWTLPVLGAGQQLVARTWQLLTSPGSGGKALWLWLAFAAAIYAISGGAESPRESIAHGGAVRARDRAPLMSARVSAHIDATSGRADTTASLLDAPVAQTDALAEVIAAAAPDDDDSEHDPAPAADLDSPRDLRPEDCRWDAETGWRCPGKQSSFEPRADPLCAQVQQHMFAGEALAMASPTARRFLAAVTLANRALARILGCPGAADAIDRPAAGAGGQRTYDDPSCVTETRPDGTPCTVCPDQQPVCAPAQCQSHARTDGTSCSTCIDANGETQSDCIPHTSGLPERCFTVEPSGQRVVVLDLAAETITYTSHRFPAAATLSSLGLTRNHLVACLFPTATVDILDLATGAHTQVHMPCDSVTAMGDKIYVNALGFPLTEFADLRALIAKTPRRTFPDQFISRVGAGDQRLLGAWHSDDEVLAFDPETGVSTAIPLPGYDGWIFGLFENAHARLVAGGWVETGLNVYDRASGQPIGRLFDGVLLQGLACSPSP